MQHKASFSFCDFHHHLEENADLDLWKLLGDVKSS